jgi:hypothetical protein
MPMMILVWTGLGFATQDLRAGVNLKAIQTSSSTGLTRSENSQYPMKERRGSDVDV